MSAARAGYDLKVSLSLFEHAYHREIALESGHRFGHDRAAFVIYDIRLHAALFELRNKLRAALTGHLFIVRGREIHILFRNKAVL